MSSTPHPAIKVSVVIAALMLLRLVVVGLLPGMGLQGLAWPLHGLFFIWVVAFWTNGGGLRM